MVGSPQQFWDQFKPDEDWNCQRPLVVLSIKIIKIECLNESTIKETSNNEFLNLISRVQFEKAELKE